MEPLLTPDGDEYEEAHNKPHLVYRQGRKNVSSTDEPHAAPGNRLLNYAASNRRLSDFPATTPFISHIHFPKDGNKSFKLE